jgi:hypothetical protein
MLPYVYVEAVRRSGARAILLPPGGDDEEAQRHRRQPGRPGGLGWP